jgi:HEPN domain-containing protein
LFCRELRFSRVEAEYWFKQAVEDFKLAEKLLSDGKYNYSAFLAHQAAEKILNALIIEVLREIPPRVHNLLELGEALRKTGIDMAEVEDGLKYLNPHYLTSRYPDAANGVPTEVYSRRMAELCLQSAKRVLAWAENLLEKK